MAATGFSETEIAEYTAWYFRS